jgi:ribosomal subunit interface protein
VDVVVKGRHVDVSDRFREHAEEKLSRLEKYDQRLMRAEVQVSQERNPRLSAQSHRVELTLRSKGPAIRAEAAAEDKMAALDLALERLQAQLRKAADRRRVHHGSRRPASLAELPVESGVLEAEPATQSTAAAQPEPDRPLVVREKTHQAAPMSIDQALYEMELVGHDFYLFHDEATGRPAVVYRRHGYDYGVIRLEN